MRKNYAQQMIDKCVATATNTPPPDQVQLVVTATAPPDKRLVADTLPAGPRFPGRAAPLVVTKLGVTGDYDNISAVGGALALTLNGFIYSPARTTPYIPSLSIPR